MISNRLKILFVFSAPLFIAHGLEEIYTGFYAIDSHVAFAFGWLANLPTLQGLFVLFQIMLWLTLIISYLLLLGPKWQFRLMLIPGIIFVYELHHAYKAIAMGGYYPGLVTAIPLYILGFFFWKEWLKLMKSK
ncbi:HXXEE domain-containing protein [Patescibacteria group bacterium]|nr:HXXEE domain-containing protein [Patescibacteria group bacterium]